MYNGIGTRRSSTLDIKFRINAQRPVIWRGTVALTIVGLRVPQVNHNCRPDAGHINDETTHVQILFAQRDIHPGEEICISYCSFANLNMERETSSAKIRTQNPESKSESVQQVLQSIWGITCPDNCYCKDLLARKLVLDGRKMKEELDDLAGRGWTDQAFKAGEKLLEIQRRLDVSWICRVSTELYLFQVAIGRRKTLPEAEKHIRAVYDVYKLICSHSKSTTMKYEKLLSHPEWDGNYLVMECNRDRC